MAELNARTISIEEVREAVNEMKSGKAPGLDGWISSGVLKEMWYGNVKMASKTVERKF